MGLYAEPFTGVWRILKNLSINCLPEVKGEVIICFLILSTVLLGRLTSSRVTFDSLDIRNSTEKIIKSNVHCYKYLLNILFYISFWRHSRDFHLFIHCVCNTCTCTNTKIIVIFSPNLHVLIHFYKKNNSASQALETKFSLLYDVINYLPTKKCCTFKYPEM